jgi:antitoxin CptB
MVSEQEINRMRWAARRGMLELDLVLEPYVEARYADLDEDDRARFHRLMACEDQDLFAWFMQRQRPDDAELATLVDKILAFARTAPADR